MVVYTKEDLKSAIERKESQIEIVGSLAEKIAKNEKSKRYIKIAGALAVTAGIVAAPFTGGTSLIATAMGATAVDEGVVLIVVIASIAGLGWYALKKNYDVVIEFDARGKVLRVKMTRK